MEKILLATNGKESAKKAEEYAINLTIEKGLSLTIVYVRDSIWYRFSEEVDWLSTHRARRDFQKYIEEVIDAEEEAIFNRLKNILTDNGISSKMVTIYGDPAREIVKYAEDEGSDLIIIGDKEKKGFAKWFGSTSSRIAKRARCKVMVVK